MNIFKRKEALADTPREVLNWKLYWSVGVFGVYIIIITMH